VRASSRRPQRGRRSSLRQEAGAGRCPGAGRRLPESALPEGFVPVGWRKGVLPSGPEADRVKRRGRSVAGRPRDGGRNGGVRSAARSGSAAVAGQPRSWTEGRRVSFLPEATTGVSFCPKDGSLRRWHRSRRDGAGGGRLAGGRNEGVRAPTTTPSPAGRSASSSEAPAFLCQTGLRLSGHCGPGWRWTAGARRGGGGWTAVGRWRCRGEEPAVGAEEPGPSLYLKGGSGRAFCLGRRMGVCLRLHPGRWPQGGGRSAVCPGGRCRVRPLGWMKRGAASRSGQAG
jgi:hypothetical protein